MMEYGFSQFSIRLSILESALQGISSENQPPVVGVQRLDMDWGSHQALEFAEGMREPCRGSLCKHLQPAEWGSVVELVVVADRAVADRAVVADRLVGLDFVQGSFADVVVGPDLAG